MPTIALTGTNSGGVIISTVALTITPAAAPGFDLNFAADTYVVGGATKTLAEVLTLTRSSAGTYIDGSGVLQSVGNNVARIDHAKASPFATRGLLVETAATNRLLRSREFASAPWSVLQGGTGVAPVITADFAAGPSGGVTADRVQFDRGVGVGNGDFSLLYQQISGTSALYTSGLWLKSNTAGNFNILVYAIGLLVANDFTITPAWQRVLLGRSTYKDSNFTASADPYLVFGVRGGTGDPQHATQDNGPQTADILVSDAFMEVGDLTENSTDIITTSAVGTRAADVAGLSSIFATMGTLNVTVTYDDNSTSSHPGAAVTTGYWPTLTRPRVKRILGVTP